MRRQNSANKHFKFLFQINLDKRKITIQNCKKVYNAACKCQRYCNFKLTQKVVTFIYLFKIMKIIKQNIFPSKCVKRSLKPFVFIYIYIKRYSL